MPVNDPLKYAWREVSRRKGRSAGAMISYFLAGAIIVAVAAAAGITRDTTRRVLWDIGAHTVAYIPRLTIEGCCIQTYATDLYDPDREGFVINNAPTNLIFEEQVELIRRSPNVADASPYLMFRLRSSLGTGEWNIGGIDLTRPVAYSATVVARSQVVKGEFLDTTATDLVMVEQEFAGTWGLDVGSELLLGDRMYRIAAIVNPPLRPGKANIYMSLPALQELVATRLEEHSDYPVNAILVESLGAPYHEAAKSDIAGILGQGSRITSYGCHQPGVLAMGITVNSAWTVTLIVVICMFLIAMRIQYSSVMLRKFDIGILKAIGWSDRDILMQIMSESFIYSFTGGTAGVIAAFGVMQVLPDGITAGQDIAADPNLIMAGILLPVAGGMITGIISSLAAVRLRTSDILRSL